MDACNPAGMLWGARSWVRNVTEAIILYHALPVHFSWNVLMKHCLPRLGGALGSATELVTLASLDLLGHYAGMKSWVCSHFIILPPLPPLSSLIQNM